MNAAAYLRQHLATCTSALNRLFETLIKSATARDSGEK